MFFKLAAIRIIQASSKWGSFGQNMATNLPSFAASFAAGNTASYSTQ